MDTAVETVQPDVSVYVDTGDLSVHELPELNKAGVLGYRPHLVQVDDPDSDYKE